MTLRRTILLHSSAVIALAFAGTTAQAQAGDPAGAEAGAIIVTATKRSQRLSDVPQPISVVSQEELAKLNAQSLADYITRLPGVSFNDYQPGISEVVIRGVAATTYHEQGQTTTGYYLNEIPLVEPGFPVGIPDVDTFDLERVEVLRGPQGTLFGSSSLGGAINYVVATADPTMLDAAAQGIVGSTKNASGELNWAGKAMVNVPLEDGRLGIRLTALQRVDAGFADNIATGVEGSNDLRTRGLRGSVVALPSDRLTITYLSNYQDTRLDDQTYVDINGGVYERNVPRAETQETDFWLNSLRFDYDADWATASVFGSTIKKNNTTVYSYPSPYVTGVTTGDDAAYSLGEASAIIRTAEARLASVDDGGPFNWLIGTSFIHSEKSSFDGIYQNGAAAVIDANQDTYVAPGSVLAPGDRIYGYLSEGTTDDFGIFGEVSFRPIDMLEITAGGRFFWNEYDALVNNNAGAIANRATDIVSQVGNKEDGFTPKVTVSLRPATDLLLYATYSEGYRIGGVNPNAGLLDTIPAAYDSDGVDNYEAGIKVSLLDRTLFVDATVFTLDWNGIQARLFGPAPTYYSYVTNAGSAEVTGVELSATWQPVPLVGFSTNVAYTDAELSEFLPDTFAPGGGYEPGTTLPGSSDWTVSNTVTFALDEVAGDPTLQVAHRYLSEAPVAFGNPATRGGFNIFDLRASIGAWDQFRLTGFVNNVFDEYGILSAPFADAVLPLGSITRPRTYGLRIDWAL